MPRTYVWVILSCLHWWKRETPGAGSTMPSVPATLRCPTCNALAQVLDVCPVNEGNR